MEEHDEQAGLLAIARAIHRLGNADASTPMGGLEALGKVILESNEHIAMAIGDLASAVHRLADNAEQGGSA
ncbi:MAG TPA: hypothetical protein VM366_06200 [Anaerolineae bacterium]|nr:hypothetical protein [Anaerolineae bacterium]